jgi:hypothetical protein
MRAGGGAQSPTREKRKKEKRTSVDLVSFQTQKTGSRLPSPVWSVLIITEITSSAMPRVGGGGAQTLGSSKRLRFVERRGGWDGMGPELDSEL